MRLPEPFYRLAVRFDVDRMRSEIESLAESAWVAHPEKYAGNSSVRLISSDGGENDRVGGEMRPTPHLERCPYIRQVLASFGVVWSRSRLMKLAPRSEVPEHADINYHWFTRVRVHIPVVTLPDVRFACGGQTIHMAAGEAWIFDNWRRHRVVNPTDHERIHLVADTSGTAAFWQRVAESRRQPPPEDRFLPYRQGEAVRLLTERTLGSAVMPPSELELLVRDLAAELVGVQDDAETRRAIALFRMHLEGFCQDWRQLWLLHGESPSGWPDYARLRDGMRARAAQIGAGLQMRTNSVAATRVLEGRVLRHVLNAPEPPVSTTGAPKASTSPRTATPRFERPLFIVAAPRSGSTLLFETLACTPQLWTLGGEAHWMVEGFPQLRPGAAGVESNRLTELHCDPGMAEELRRRVAAELRDPSGRRWMDAESVRFLEKTPKNALRIPFLDRVFPDALYVFLWREPQSNLSSMLEAWRSGRFITYPQLPEWNGPWSMLLPPGWRHLRGRPLEEVCAHQWETTNRLVMEDLARLPPDRWISLRYEDLVANPAASLRRICAFSGLIFDEALAGRCAGALPHSRHTHTPPHPDKWHRNAADIGRVLPALEPTLRALLQLPNR